MGKGKAWLVFTLLGTVCLMLASCGLHFLHVDKNDAPLLSGGYDASGNPTYTQVGTVPAGATCTFQAAHNDAGNVYVNVADCAKDGQNYGSGMIAADYFTEREDLFRSAK